MIDAIRGKLLGMVDWINIKLDPFEEFDRLCVPAVGSLITADSYFWNDIQNNWLHGYDKELYWSMAPNDGGDMAIWHGVYTATCALRGDKDALARALIGCRVLQGEGSDDRLVRGATEPGGPLGIDPTRTYYKRTVNGRDYEVLADVSESSIIGHVFGLWMAYGFGDSDASAAAATMLRDLARTVSFDGNRLLNPDGTPAKFGDLRPGATTAPIRIAALAMLYAAAAASNNNDPVFRGYVEDLERNHAGALLHPETHFLWIHPWYQDIIAYMALVVLKDARVGKTDIYIKSLEGLWAKNRKEGNSFYIGLLEMSGIDTDKINDAIKSLLEFGPVKEHSGVEIPGFRWGWSWAKGGQLLSRQPVPVAQRCPSDFVWQRNPYSIGGSDSRAYNMLDFCSAFSMLDRLGEIRR